MGEPKDLPFPFEVKQLDPDEDKFLRNMFDSVPLRYVRVGPKGYIVCKGYLKDAANIYNMPLRPTDIFVSSYQRSGTTLTQELVWLLANDFDYEKAAQIPLAHRYAFLDLFMLFDEDSKNEHVKNITDKNSNVDKEKLKKVIEFLTKPASRMLAEAPLTTTRFMKTHVPMSLLPPNLLDTAKVVYVARDPRDVAVSCYHHARLFRTMRFPSGFKDFWNLFHKDMFLLTPYFEHVKEAWEKRHEPNMLFLFYEDIRKDLPAAIRQVADFLGKQLTDDQMARLCDHLSIENFKNNKSVNYEEMREFGMLAPEETFIRKGKSGGWRDYFDEEMTQQADKWIADNLRDTDLRFPHMNN